MPACYQNRMKFLLGILIALLAIPTGIQVTNCADTDLKKWGRCVDSKVIQPLVKKEPRK